jgi:hypothetical protein
MPRSTRSPSKRSSSAASSPTCSSVLRPGGNSSLKHEDDEDVAVDALVYLLSQTLGGQSPSATIAIARGLSPASGPKRAANARQAGLISTIVTERLTLTRFVAGAEAMFAVLRR